MKQKVAIALVVVLALCATCQLMGARSAADGVMAYVNRTTWVYARPSTSAPKTRVAKGTKVAVMAVRSTWAWIQKGKAKGYIPKRYLSKRPVATPTPRPTTRPTTPLWRRQVEKLDWFKGGSGVLRKGSYATIYDIDTGITVKIKRLGGTNHMDVEPVTKADTEKLRKIAGGQFSWKSHAVVLIVRNRYIAAAINTMPHGEQTIKDNDFLGQFCLHLTNSRTHETDRVSPDHQASIERVMKWAKK